MTSRASRRAPDAVTGRTARIVLVLAVLAGLLAAAPLPTAHAASYPPMIAFDDRNGGPGTTAVFFARPGLDGSDHVAITGASDPAWSPAGDRLAFLVTNPSTDAVSLLIGDRAGRGAHVLITGPGRGNNDPTSVNGPIAWSPNGREIAYQCRTYSPDETITLGQLCLVDVTTGTRHQITTASTAFPGLVSGTGQRLAWTPDGSTVVGSAFQHVACSTPPSGPFTQPWCGYPAVTAITIRSGAADVLTPADTHAVTPDVSPDGRHIAYYDEAVGVRVMGSNGGSPRTVVTNAVLFGGALSDTPYPLFSPDGRELLFTKYATGNAPGTGYAQLYTIDAGGSGAPDQLTHHAFDAFRAVWTSLRTTCTVPALAGKTIAQATAALKRAACALGTVTGPRTNRAKRHVSKQSLKANTERPAGTKVNIAVR